MRKLRILLSALLLVVSMTAVPPHTQATGILATGGAVDSTLPNIPVEKYKLKNGLEIILSENHSLPLVSINIWYHVGPANERPDRTGFAHLFEHMMFEGSKHVGAKGHDKYLDAAGVSDTNGTTDFDRTNYFETLPSNQLELALWLESDRMGYLYDTLDREKLANQRDVVRNERRQSVENAPYKLVEEALFHELFPKGHPYYASVIGSHADIEAARLADVREFFKQYYCPNNASLAIVGDFDKEKVKALIDKYFGSIPAGAPVPKIEASTPPITVEKRLTVTDRVELPRVYMAWITAPIFKPGQAEADLTARILGGGKSSRLYKKLVYDLQIAQDVSVDNSPYLLGSVFMLSATAKAGVKPEILEKAINEELAEFRKNGPTQVELDAGRNSIEAGIIGGLEKTGGFGGVADRLNQYNHFLGDPGYLPRDIQRYDKVTTADLKGTADQYLQDKSRVVIYALPGNKVVEDVPQTAADKEKDKETSSTVTSMPEEAWRSAPPAPGPAPKLNLPVPVKFTLENGLQVYLLERHNVPMVSAQLAILSGSDTNPINKPGLASFTADMLDYGTSTRSATKIADDLELIGTSLEANSASDSSKVTVRTLSKTVGPAFDIFADIALHPAFEPKEIERLRSIKTTTLEQEKDEPRLLRSRAVFKMLYGEKSPYGYVEDGTLESVKSISREDMLKFWHSGYAPANSALFIVGDMTLEQARNSVQKNFGDWKGTATVPATVEVKNDVHPTVYIENKEAAPQTSVSVACIGLARSNPDYVPAEVMNRAFGGMFTSRLNMNLRETHGYTYGVNSRFFFRRSPGPFSAGGNIRTDVTGPAVAEIFKEIELLRSSPLTGQELKKAKDNMALSLPGQFESSLTTASSLSNLFVYDLPVDYYRTLPERINKVSGSDVERVVTTYLKPIKMIVVAVGDKAKIEPQLKSLNRGEIIELNYEANPIK